jgi:curved DNA-binding protein CbpA
LEQHEEFTDYYKLFNVERNVDDKKLYEAYTSIARRYAIPDGASPALEHRIETEFAIYKTAFSVLSDPTKRKDYDLKLKLYETKKEEENVKQQIENRRKEKLEKENPVDLQSVSPIKNDPRLRNSIPGISLSQFKVIEYDQKKLDVVHQEREQHEKQKSEEKFLKAKQYILEGNNEAAIDSLKELVEKYPKVSQYHSYLGLAMQNKGWTGYSQAEFKVALHFNPKDEIALKYYQNPVQKQAKPEEKKSGFFGNLFKKK